MPFALPLSDDEFRRAVHDGRGRAVLHIRGGHPVTAFHKSVLVDACVNCSTFDPQCEDDRALWVWSLCQASGIVEDAGRAVIERPAILDSDSMDTWDAHHQASILRLAAQSGVPQAREALYALFDRNPQGQSWIARSDLLMLDGLSGLLHLARRFGQAIVREEYAYLVPWTFSNAVEAHGRDAVMACLESAALEEADVAAFLTAVLRDETNVEQALAPQPAESSRQSPDMSSLSFEEVERSFPPGRLDRIRFGAWGRDASDAAIQRAFGLFVSATDPIQIRRLVSCFSDRAAPDFHPRVLDLLSSDDRSTRHSAGRAITLIKHPLVRQAAMQRLNAGLMDERTVQLLASNFDPQDEADMLELLSRSQGRDDRHRTCWWLVGKEKGRPHWPASLVIWGYEHTPCELCRSHAVRHLLERSEAPRWLLEEACEDSNEQTRERARAALQEHDSG